MPIQQSTHQGIEYLHDSPENPSKSPILLIHGAYNNAFIWQHNFIPYLVEKGHPVYAIHLKKQETVSHIKTLFSYSLKAYVKRLATLIEKIDGKPILVGHSMGGLVVQKYLSKYPGKVEGACLLASLPFFGLRNTLWGMIKRPSILLAYTILTLAPHLTRYGKTPRGLLSKRVSDPQNLQQFQDSIQRESGIALTNCLFPGVNIEQVKKHPLLIFGASLDNLALEGDVRKTGKTYGTEAQIFTEAAHFLMMEPEWQDIADQISSLHEREATAPTV